MVNISHAVLAGTEIHEPKGVATANLGEVYVADGNGSGNWSNVGTSSFTGMIADFTWPVVQSGWLECDGSDVNTTTYSALYDVMTIQMTGTRTNGSAVITSLASTANMRVGYYVFGTGISSGTTILSIDSGSQITLSTNASSPGTSTVVVSPWLLNTGTIRLPDISAAGRYRRSRTASTAVGQLQASQNLAHTHGVSGTTGNESVFHTHGYSGTTGAMNGNQQHAHTQQQTTVPVNFGTATLAYAVPGSGGFTAANPTDATNTDHTHNYAGNTGVQSVSHTHQLSTTSDSTGSSEARPLSIVVMTCVKI